MFYTIQHYLVVGAIAVFILFFLLIIVVSWVAYKSHLKCILLDKHNALLEQEKASLLKETATKEELISSLQTGKTDNTVNTLLEAINNKFSNTMQQMSEERQNTLKSLLENASNMKSDLMKESGTKFEEIIQKVTTELAQNVSKQSIVLNQLYIDTKKITSAFTSSNKIGSFHEQQLAVTLENMGFRHNESFYTQFTTSDSLKPDAVIKLPNNDFIVIDCKSSAAFMPAGDGVLSELNAEDKLSESMKRHIITLGKKDYFSSVLNEMKLRNKAVSMENARCSITLMYLPTDISLEKAQIAYDKKYGSGQWIIDCKANNILPCGPSGLHAIISIASHNISVEDANRNYFANQEKIKNLLKELNSMLGHIIKVGDYLVKTAESYAKFYKVWNGKFFKAANQFMSNDYKLDIKKMPEYHFAKGDEIEEEKTTMIESDEAVNK